MRKMVLALHQAGIEYEEYVQLREYLGNYPQKNRSAVVDVIGAKKEAKLYQSCQALPTLLSVLEKQEVAYFCCEDENFPPFLLSMPNPAYLFYYKGDLSLIHEFSIGIIGSRKPTAYGKFVATKFAKELSQQGVVIVSGFAMGIDTFSHRGATDNQGKTIAVLGTAINNIYPRSNEPYAKELLEKGNLILSEFAPDTKTLPFHFVQRNRLISALSDGLLIVEAGEKSGTLTTVDFALEQGHTIFSVPGNINSPNSAGTNRLIKLGAKPVTEVQDIMEEFPFYVPKKKKSPQIKLSQEEQAIYDTLLEHGLLTNEEISFFTNQNIKYIIGTLSVLELKGIIKDLGNNTYTING